MLENTKDTILEPFGWPVHTLHIVSFQPVDWMSLHTVPVSVDQSFHFCYSHYTIHAGVLGIFMQVENITTTNKYSMWLETVSDALWRTWNTWKCLVMDGCSLQGITTFPHLKLRPCQRPCCVKQRSERKITDSHLTLMVSWQMLCTIGETEIPFYST